VTRLINQMRFLARDTVFDKQTFPLEPLISEAYQEAQRYQPAKTAKLKFDDHQQHLLITGDRAALKHALAETLLNAIQANPADAKIGVSASTDTTAGGRWVSIEVHDNGPGFPPDAAKRGAEAFFTTRNVGLGLGLTVSRKIIETHRGKLEIVDPKTGQPGVVRISLPVEA
jgi:signal transduction histidine kinase